MKSEMVSQVRNVVEVRATYDASEVRRFVDRTCRDLASKVRINGFRKGRVPRRALEMYVGRQHIYREAIASIYDDAVREAVEQYDLELVTAPSFPAPASELDEQKEFEVLMSLEVRPEVTLPADLSALTAVRMTYTTDEADVDRELDRLRESAAAIVPSDDTTPASKTDIVEVVYTARDKNDAGDDPLEAEKRTVLHLSSVRTDIADAVIGKAPGDAFSFEIKIEDDYPSGSIAGHTISYDMKMERKMKREIPEADDALAERLSGGRLKTMEELRKDLREAIDDDAKARSDAELRERALDAISAAAEVDVPDSMIDRQYTEMRKNEAASIQSQLSKTLEEYLDASNIKIEDFDKELRERAASSVRNTLIIDAVAERENISFTSEDISEEIINMSRTMRINPQAMADTISSDQDMFARVAGRVRFRNTLKFLAERISVTEETKTYVSLHTEEEEAK